MRCGDQYFVLARCRISRHRTAAATPGPPRLPVSGEDFDAALAMSRPAASVLLYEDKGHRSFTGRHAYFHDPDGNAIEFIDFHGVGDVSAPDYQGRERRAQSHLSDKAPV
jgi:hypothetical protein